MRPQPAVLRLLLGMLLLSACLPQTPSPVPAGPTPSASPAPQASSTAPPSLPPLEISDLRLIEQAAGWLAVGLIVNQDSQTWGELLIRLEFLSEDDLALESFEIRPLVDVLGPKTSAPFSLFLPDRVPSTRLRANLIHFAESDFQPLPLLVEIGRTLPAGGSTLILGEIANPGAAAVLLEGLFIVAAQDPEQIRAIARADDYPPRLEPGEKLPFSALLNVPHGPLTLAAYHQARPAPPLVPSGEIIFATPPQLSSTAQGNRLVGGMLQSASFGLKRVSLLLGLYLEDQLIGFKRIVPQVPLGRGDQLPFSAAEFPGLAALLSDNPGADLRLETWISAELLDRPPTDLVALIPQVGRYEPQGETLFIGGSLTNHLSSAVRFPTIYASITDLDFRLLSGGWQELDLTLQPGETAEYRLSIPLPEGTNLARSEFHLWAAALLQRP